MTEGLYFEPAEDRCTWCDVPLAGAGGVSTADGGTFCSGRCAAEWCERYAEPL